MKLGVFVSMMSVGLAAFADPSITEVTAVQRYPWNGKVDISYKASGIASAAKENGWLTSLKVTATDKQSGTTYTATSLTGDTSVSDGTHAAVWDMSAQGLTLKSTNVVFDVTCETTQALYCVVDLSGGTTATSYPVSYLADVPSGGWTDEYKTTKLVLRYIAPGSFKMFGTDDVTITNGYYIGVFEVTQKQYGLLTGLSYSGATPVVYVTWDEAREAATRLNEKTGFWFDLPTEALWEYACRAGTTTTYSYGNDVNGNYMWYEGNSSSQAHEVGTRGSNAWGLYDMHGNVCEWCFDLIPGVMQYRVVRGGSWHDYANACTSSSRKGFVGSQYYNDRGFRLSRTVK